MSQTKKSLVRKVTRTVRRRYLLFLPQGYEPRGRRWPLILFLHGAGERGSKLEQVKKHGMARIVDEHPDFPAIVVSPQCPADGWWRSEELTMLLDEIEESCRVDPDRIYVTGLSMGGFGTWQLAIDQPRRFAAIAPICGRGNPLLAQRITHLPTWVFHGAKDNVVPLSNSHDMVKALRKHGGKPRFTIYPDAAHDSWTRTYDNPRFFAWLLAQRRRQGTGSPSRRAPRQ